MQLTGKAIVVVVQNLEFAGKEKGPRWSLHFNNKEHPSMLLKDWMPVTSWESALSSQPQKALKKFPFIEKQFRILFSLF